MYEVTSKFNNNIIYVLGVHHYDIYDKLDDKIKNIIDKCNVLALETNLDTINLCVKENDTSLKDRIESSSYQLIGKYLDIEEVKYANFDTVIKVIIFYIVRNRIKKIANDECTFLERTLWNKFTNKISLESIEEHKQRAIDMMSILVPERNLNRLVENKLKYNDVYTFIDTVVNILESIKEIPSISSVNADSTNIVCKNDLKMVNKIHEYNLSTKNSEKILVVTGMLHINNIINGLIEKGYEVVEIEK